MGPLLFILIIYLSIIGDLRNVIMQSMYLFLFMSFFA